MIKGVTLTNQTNSLTLTNQTNSLTIETIDIYTYYNFLSNFMIDEEHEEVQS